MEHGPVPFAARSISIAIRVAYPIPHIGPYHHARFNATTAGMKLTVLEYGDMTGVAYEEVKSLGVYSRQRVQVTRRGLRHDLATALDLLKPDILVTPGWSERAALHALAWSTRNRVPAIVVSDSQMGDYTRQWWIESVKRRMVSLFSVAFVAGTRHVEYVASLGIPRDCIFTGMDVVDNGHFHQGAEDARNSHELQRMRYGLPARYFLASNRFVANKNLSRLLEAFAHYRVLHGERAWSLVLLGDGELRRELEVQRKLMGLEYAVSMPGLKPYDELPAYYGLAGAFVLASTSEQWGLVVNEAMAAGLPVLVSNPCGCAPDLVHEGCNGWTFDPLDVESLAHLLLNVSSMSETKRLAMGTASRNIIEHWSPERFAESLWKAAETALATPQPRPRVLDRLLLMLLQRR
jgi:glycosyltransferase involved in cell wall biosynthesis